MLGTLRSYEMLSGPKMVLGQRGERTWKTGWCKIKIKQQQKEEREKLGSHQKLKKANRGESGDEK